MRTELEDRLREDHPGLFRHLRTDPMLHPLGRGVEAADGWFDLIDRLCGRVAEELAARPDEAFAFEQVKEKFGVLKVYTTPTTNKCILDLIAAAREESRTTCELCGAAGALACGNGRWRTLCPECRGHPDGTGGLG
jgi:hypothetical protein